MPDPGVTVKVGILGNRIKYLSLSPEKGRLFFVYDKNTLSNMKYINILFFISVFFIKENS